LADGDCNVIEGRAQTGFMAAGSRRNNEPRRSHMLSTLGIVIFAIFATLVVAIGAANEASVRNRTQGVESASKAQRSTYEAA